jgi:acyl-CoA thioesterase FadM
MALTTGRRGDYRMGDEGRLSFRCLPTDIDFNRHLNNARYMMLADVGRIDIFFRTGLIAKARENGWAPMLGGLQIVFVREIRLWRKFDVVSTVETWDGTQIIGRHKFVLDSGETAAVILTAAGIYDRRNRRFIDIDDLFAALGYSATPRPPTEVERVFMASHTGLRALAKGGDGRKATR